MTNSTFQCTTPLKKTKLLVKHSWTCTASISKACLKSSIKTDKNVPTALQLLLSTRLSVMNVIGICFKFCWLGTTSTLKETMLSTTLEIMCLPWRPRKDFRVMLISVSSSRNITLSGTDLRCWCCFRLKISHFTASFGEKRSSSLKMNWFKPLWEASTAGTYSFSTWFVSIKSL